MIPTLTTPITDYTLAYDRLLDDSITDASLQYSVMAMGSPSRHDLQCLLTH
jgi:hypothetical protein